MADPDFEVSVSSSRRHVRITVNKPMTSEIGHRCGAEAVALGKANELGSFLFDLRRAPNIQPVLTNYEFAYKDMQGFGFPRGSRSALLTDPTDRSHDFLETVFMNAGYNVRIFADEASAIDWLEQ